MKHAPRITLLACVAACLAYVYSCQATSNTLARWGGAATGAGIGAAFGGPLGAAGGAIAGDAVANAVVPQPQEPQTVIHAATGSTVYATQGDGPTPWYLRWYTLAGGAFLFYRRAPLLRAAKAATSPRALALNLWSALWASEKAAEVSKQATAFHAMQREDKKKRKVVAG